MQWPLWERIKDWDNILLAGAGGGFDIFCGLPLYFALQKAGKKVHMANLSFTNLSMTTAERLTPHVVEVTADSGGPVAYFPEKFLCDWFRDQGEEVSIWAFERTGVVPLTAAWRALAEHLGVEHIVLIDGGTDSLMRGDEVGLGTPAEDMATVAAATALGLPSVMVCLGFGIDTFHGVCHAHFLEGVSELSKEGAYLGAFSLLREMPEVARYIDAVNTVCAVMKDHPSIVNTSIVGAIEGDYGDVHRTHRTRGSELWINPLMGLYWGFELHAVARRVLYLDKLAHTRTFFEVLSTIDALRGSWETRPWKSIPV